jgi:hypothetical protein
MGNAVEARFREFRGHEIQQRTFVNSRGRKQAECCSYAISAVASGEDGLRRTATDWLNQFPTAPNFVHQDFTGFPQHHEPDVIAWFEGNPHGFGKNRILGVAEQCGCPIPPVACGRMKDLDEFIELARCLAVGQAK